MAVTIRGSGQLIVQIVQTVKTDIYTSTSSTYVPITGMAVTITPSSASNKILVCYNLNAGVAGAAGGIQLWRNGSVINAFIGDAVSGISNQVTYNVYNNGDSNSFYQANNMLLDSPATTSAVTYQLYGAQVQGGAGTMVVNDMTSQVRGTNYSSIGISTITAFEVSYA